MAGTSAWEDLASVLEGALESDGTGVMVCMTDGSLLYANRTALRFFDREGEPLPGTISDISDSIASLLSEAQKKGRSAASELQVTSPSGSVRWLRYSASFIELKKGGGPATAIILHDVTSLHGTMSHEKLNSIVDSLEDGYYETDLSGHFTHVNTAMCDITEYSANEILGVSYKKLYTPEDVEKIYNSYHEVFVTGKPARLINFFAITKHGRKKLMEGSVALAKEADGTVTGFRGIVRDVSEKQKIEKELLRARKLEAIGILAGGIAHDYNNALTAILGNISLAKMEASPDNGGLIEVLNDAEEASLKAVELTRRLSTFARGGKPERQVVDCSDSIRATVDSVLGGYHGTYEVVIGKELWKVDVDEFQIGQVITFILNNAVESMSKPGPIRVTAENVVVEKEESHHEITLQPGNYVKVSISDEGVGIAPEDIHSIFDPYYTTKDVASGMGLATSYAIIKRHHGYIDVKSVLGGGTTFYIYLPVAH
ncbi:MAG: PAS domain S-box protein [Spirochaetes bacterium]|nr:PAS domain S-box protein [Spirochaetota bacterium]